MEILDDRENMEMLANQVMLQMQEINDLKADLILARLKLTQARALAAAAPELLAACEYIATFLDTDEEWDFDETLLRQAIAKARPNKTDPGKV